MMTSRWSATATGPATNGLSSGSMTSAYAELHCHSNYSFLEGASHPDELVARARDLEMPALAIPDRNGFYGAVKFFGAAERAGIQAIIGTELTIDDGTRPPKDRVDYDRWGDRLLLLVEDKLVYTSLCRVISMAQMPNAKGMARLPAEQLASLSGHLIALVADPKERLPIYQEIFGRDRVFIELHDHLAPDDRSRNQRLLDLAERHGAPLVITNEVFYATPDRHRLHDVLTAIRHRTTLDEAQRYLHPNAEYYLKSGAELREAFGRYPTCVVDEGMAHAAEIAQRCRFKFDLVAARFPGFPVPAGETPFSFLYRLCQDAYRHGSAICEVGEELGFKEESIDHLAKSASAWHAESPETIAHAAGYPTTNIAQPWQQLFDRASQILEFPRHLSIHVGGMLVTGEPLIDIVPVERATMPGRMVVQFNKDDVEELGLIKMDMLGLRMLSVVAEALDLIEADTGIRPDLDALDLKDPEVYELCTEADTIGVFQIESRAQMQTLPRSRPENFNDLVVEVAIIRPGPIQGDAVHPYLRRKQGREPVMYIHPRLKPILEETLGVVLYQEQILKISMECASFSSAEADHFRRAMSSHRSHELMAAIRERFLNGCAQNEIPQPIAEKIFTKLAAFAEFGFTKSHAAAFARTCYETAWLKLHHAPALYAGLLNNQPMGFYHPHVLVEDAKHHGVKILPVDINKSYVRCTVEGGALRLGFNYVHGVGDKALEVLEEAQLKGPVGSLEEFCRRIRLTTQSRNGLTKAQVQNLVLAGAFDALEPNRREAVWRFNEHADDWQHSPMLAEPSESVSLTPMTHRERVATDYRLLSLTTTDHLIHFYRPQFNALHVIDSKKIRSSVRDGAKVRVGGLVITRQSPSTGKEFKFFTLADEFGHVDVILRPPIYQRYRQVANLEPILIMDGRLQKQYGVLSVLVDHVEAAPCLPDEDVFPMSRNYR